MRNKNIPNKFLYYDTHAFADNTSLNVRECRNLNKNHNILMARRIRRPIVTQAFYSDEAGSAQTFISVMPVNEFGEGEAIWRGNVRISPFVQAIRVNVIGYRSSVADEAKIYPYLSGPARRQPVNQSLEIAIDSGTSAKYGVTLPVPNDCFINGPGKPGRAELSLLYSCMMGASIKGAVTITSWGETGGGGYGRVWFEASTSGSVTGLVAHFSDTQIRPRVIVDSVLVTGTVYRCYIDGPWESTPVIGTTTVGMYSVVNLNIRSICAHELELTSFDGDREDM